MGQVLQPPMKRNAKLETSMKNREVKPIAEMKRRGRKGRKHKR